MYACINNYAYSNNNLFVMIYIYIALRPTRLGPFTWTKTRVCACFSPALPPATPLELTWPHNETQLVCSIPKEVVVITT